MKKIAFNCGSCYTPTLYGPWGMVRIRAICVEAVNYRFRLVESSSKIGGIVISQKLNAGLLENFVKNKISFYCHVTPQCTWLLKNITVFVS